MKRLILAGMALLLASACCRDSSCAHQNLDINFVGWSTTDVDTLVLRRFAAGSNVEIDSSQIAIASFIGHGDTLSPGYVTSSGLKYLFAGYDWTVELSQGGRVYNIDNINESGSDGGKDCSLIPYKQKDFCVATVMGYKVDGYYYNSSSGFISVYLFK